MSRPQDLLQLAERCETSPKPDRELDADIYEALGFTVRRKPARLTSKRIPAGGIYQQGNLWKTLGAVSADIDVAVSLLKEKAPNWNWSLQYLVGDQALTFEALVAECTGQGMAGSLALCAAMLRAFAKTRASETASRKLDPTAQGDG